MANPEDRFPQNAPGAFYVDSSCIDCDLCREIAPGIFLRNDEGGHSYVARQPSTPNELERAREALLGCPVEAIGDDGVKSPPNSLPS